MDTESFWYEERQGVPFPALDHDLDVEVLIIGGGIAGVTAAYLLSAQGRSVALVERGRIGGLNTGRTTAHLTYMTDNRLSDLVATFSRKEARLAWEAGQAAIDLIEANVKRHAIDCEFRRVPGYLMASDQCDLAEERSLLQQEAMVARQMGFDVYYLDAAPVTDRPGIRFENQAKFHPLRYLDALAREAVNQGAEIYEETEVTSFDEGSVIAGGRRVKFRQVFVATHVPLQGEGGVLGSALFQSKLALYSSYAVRARLPGDELPELIWSDTADPFYYLRIEKNAEGISCVFGGEDHRTGMEAHTENRYESLERELEKILPGAQVTHRWSGQIVEPVDGLPYIGRTSDTQFIATGFSGNGMTFGTVAGMMVRDAISGKNNGWEKLFGPGRKSASAFMEYLRENKDYPVRMVSDRVNVEECDPATIAPGTGKVLEHEGERIAAFRDARGNLTRCSAVCPHLGCIVAWNEAERTWDCPCHGSRFHATGELLAGPAEKGLEPLS